MNAGRYVGVDVGGTKVAVAALEGDTLSPPVAEPTEQRSGEALVEQLARVIAAAGPADAAGIGAPSVIDWETGTARASVNVPLQDVPLRALLSERLGMPVFVDNDANCAALAEAHDTGVRHLVMFTVGTGVGGGVVIDGRPFRGATGAAPEIGHMIVGLDLEKGAPPAAERFPQPGSLEALARGGAVDALAREHGLADGRAAVAAAQSGDEGATAVLRLVGERLGVGIANAINLFDPEVVAIGGGVSAAGELLLGPAREVAARFVVPGVGTRTEIRVAQRGQGAGAYGAALLARYEHA
jgi:glucokinase